MKTYRTLLIIVIVFSFAIISCKDDDNSTNPIPFSLKVVYPNNGESFRVTDTVAISWEAQGFGWDTVGPSVDIYLMKADRKWKYIDITANKGLYSWVINDPRRGNIPLPAEDYKIRVQHATEPGIYDNSDFPFRIY